MSNIEHTIDSINEKLTVIESINELFFIDSINQLVNRNNNELMSIVNIYYTEDAVNIDNAVSLISDPRLTSNIKKFLDFNKHMSDFKSLKDKYTEFLEFYNHNSVIFTSNYYFLKRENIVLNSLDCINKKIEHLKFMLENLSIIHSLVHSDFINNNEVVIDKIYLYIYNKFNEFLTIEDIFNTLNNYILEVENYVNIYITDESEIIKFKKLFSKYRKINPITSTTTINYDICACGQNMIINTVTSELLCISCGSIKELIGTIFEDSQFYNQEGTRYKHGSYIPSHHCKYWLDRIIAKENNEVSQLSIEKIKKCIKRDNIQNLKNLSVEQFRIYLKETKLSKLNDHIPLIKKYITGFSPPQLSHTEVNIIYNYFDKAVKLYSKIKSDNSTNFIYYPYLLYKILELIIVDENRRNKLLSGIHLQGYNTLVNNDKKWKKICEFYPEFKYKPTDRNELH